MGSTTSTRRLSNGCTVDLWKSALAEMIGTSLLVILGCGSCYDKDLESDAQEDIQISFAFGFATATLTKCFSHISGGHINPAVTLAMLVSRRITFIRALSYAVAQLGGSLIGQSILKAVATDWNCHVTLGEDVSPFPGGIVIEGLITFVLVFTFLSTGGESNPDGSDAVCLGMCVVFCHLFAIKYTGSSMNPAKSFGAAVMSGNWKNHWVYWAGPISGGTFAALLHQLTLPSAGTFHGLKLLTGRQCRV